MLKSMRRSSARKPGTCTRRVRSRKITGTGGKDKTMVVGVLERGGTVRTTVVDSRKKHVLQTHVKTNVEAGSGIVHRCLEVV